MVIDTGGFDGVDEDERLFIGEDVVEEDAGSAFAFEWGDGVGSWFIGEGGDGAEMAKEGEIGGVAEGILGEDFQDVVAVMEGKGRHVEAVRECIEVTGEESGHFLTGFFDV